MLAQARAVEVQKILLENDIPLEVIYTESSWATAYFDEVLPRRGVVFQLFRN